jgi:hypothetical protein
VPNRDGRDGTRAGGFILVVAAALSAVLVLGGLIYATGASARHKAAMLAAGCEPSLFITGLPCTTQQMLVSHYEGIVTPASKQLNADTAAYRANEAHDLVAAQAALTSEVATEQALGNSLDAAMFTPQNRATADALITNAAANGNPAVPSAAITFTPQITVIADALVQANAACAKLTAEQAQSTSLTTLRSFDDRVQDDSAAVQAEMKLVLKAIDTPPQADQEG